MFKLSSQTTLGRSWRIKLVAEAGFEHRVDRRMRTRWGLITSPDYSAIKGDDGEVRCERR